MVLNLGDKQLNEFHEDYLENEAKKSSATARYTDQIEVCKTVDVNARKLNNITCYISIEQQEFARPYTRLGQAHENIAQFNTKAKERIPEKGLDRRTLMKCSSLADDYFRFDPTRDTLLLPVAYPRQHHPYDGIRTLKDYKVFYPNPIEPGKKYTYLYDVHKAHIRADEIERYIVPWLRAMEKVIPDIDSGKYKDKSVQRKPLPKLELPIDLLEKIHLYNTMLQLGLPRFVQQPLIHALIQQMRKTKLQDCHLSTLEITICRFHSRAMPILDPVLNYIIGTYSQREPSDRQLSETNIDHNSRKRKSRDKHSGDDPIHYYPSNKKRKLLSYTSFQAGRRKYKKDTALIPPELEVLGHSIRNWSSMKRDGTTGTTYFPLGVWGVGSKSLVKTTKEKTNQVKEDGSKPNVEGKNEGEEKEQATDKAKKKNE